MKRKYYQEYESIEDLLKQVEHYIYRTQYKDYYIYYGGTIVFPDVILLSFYKSKVKLSGWIGMGTKGELLKEKVPKTGYISIVEIKYSNLVEEVMMYVNHKRNK